MRDLTSRRGIRPAIAAPNPNSQTIDRSVPTPIQPVADQTGATYITDLKTVITLPGKIVQIVPATQAWVKATFTLETAGPVEVSSNSNWVLLSGTGQALITNVPLSFSVARGNSLYIQAGATNRLKVTIEPYPWLEQIFASAQSIARAVQGAAVVIVGAINNLRKPRT
jgi:hypothetical protein